ncbi:hypothetical protein ACP275_08G167200 [Erythranthe tilingii]
MSFDKKRVQSGKNLKGNAVRGRPRKIPIDFLGCHVPRKPRTKTIKTVFRNFDAAISSRLTKYTTKEGRCYEEFESSRSIEWWLSRPISEYIIDGPVPDLDAIGLDSHVLMHNFFEDIPEFDDDFL